MHRYISCKTKRPGQQAEIEGLGFYVIVCQNDERRMLNGDHHRPCVAIVFFGGPFLNPLCVLAEKSHHVSTNLSAMIIVKTGMAST